MPAQLRKLIDWRGYFLAFYRSWIQSLTSTLIALGGTNAVESMGMTGVGLNAKQASGVFIGITFWEIVKYLQAKPLPDTITETVTTTTVTTETEPTKESKP